MNSKETGNHFVKIKLHEPMTEGEKITSKHVFYGFDPGDSPRYADTANAIDAAIIAAEERGRSQRQAEIEVSDAKVDALRRQANALSDAAATLAAKACYLHDSRSYWRFCAIVGTIAGSALGFVWGTVL